MAVHLSAHMRFNIPYDIIKIDVIKLVMHTPSIILHFEYYSHIDCCQVNANIYNNDGELI